MLAIVLLRRPSLDVTTQDASPVASPAEGPISDLVLQPWFPLVVNGELVGTYVADFQYVDGDGQLVVEDV